MRVVSEQDLKAEQRRIYRGVAAAFVVCSAVLIGAQLSLSTRIASTPDDLRYLLLFWSGACLFVIVWVIIGIGMVSRGRRHSPSDINGSAYSPPSPNIAVQSAFLQNTLEQAFLAVIAHLALILLTGALAIPFVVGSVLLFGLGRTTFLIGYPNGAGARSFGMAVTFLPTLAAFVFAVGAMIRRLWV